MEDNKTIKKAKQRARFFQKRRKDPRYIKAMQWLGYLGLLRHSQIKPCKVPLKLEDLLYAARIEPRVRELLPAIIEQLGDLLPFEGRKLPAKICGDAPDKKQLEWFDTPAIVLARKRLKPGAKPRFRQQSSSTLGQAIRAARLERGFTQIHFSKTFGTSLRALRDLEQGATHVSIERASAILEALDRKLVISE